LCNFIMFYNFFFIISCNRMFLLFAEPKLLATKMAFFPCNLRIYTLFVNLHGGELHLCGSYLYNQIYQALCVLFLCYFINCISLLYRLNVL